MLRGSVCNISADNDWVGIDSPRFAEAFVCAFRQKVAALQAIDLAEM